MEEIIVGKIHFLGSDGNIAETMEYTDVNTYLDSIRKESNRNPDGFRLETITSLPEVRKSVDDIIYGNYGLDNPHELEWYLTIKRKSEIKIQMTSLESEMSACYRVAYFSSSSEDQAEARGCYEEMKFEYEMLQRELDEIVKGG
jgi:hypothetical protein